MQRRIFVGPGGNTTRGAEPNCSRVTLRNGILFTGCPFSDSLTHCVAHNCLMRFDQARVDSIVNKSGAKDVHVTFRWGPRISYNGIGWEIRHEHARLLCSGSAERIDVATAGQHDRRKCRQRSVPIRGRDDPSALGEKTVKGRAGCRSRGTGRTAADCRADRRPDHGYVLAAFPPGRSNRFDPRPHVVKADWKAAAVEPQRGWQATRSSGSVRRECVAAGASCRLAQTGGLSMRSREWQRR
jgi:hypothetical protein